MRPRDLFVVHLVYFVNGIGGHLAVGRLSLEVGLAVQQNKNRHTNDEIAMKRSFKRQEGEQGEAL